ncbi:MAG: S-layer homology domain-containing protein [Thermoanaerobaculia bacterium]|nr:S-layer homology domain-containing protein [Thermoanaerobaculia bacterium]
MKSRRFLSPVSLLALVTAFAVPASAAKPPQIDLSQPVKPASVKTPLKADRSPELRSITPRVNSGSGPAREAPAPKNPPYFKAGAPATDAVVQSAPGAEGVMPSPALTFEGGSNAENGALFGFIYAPPDTNGDVGPNHYVQTVNTHFSVYSKAGARLYGPAPINTLWTGFGGGCENTNDGDPIVVYDGLADRWVISQFGNASVGAPFLQCMAVSQTGDPLGAYFRYAYSFDGVFNDYPKMGIWTNAYTLTVNQFGFPGSFYAGGILLFQRDLMLVGLPNPRVVRFDLPTFGTEFWSFLPVDLDGNVPPPAGAPPMFLNVSDNTETIYGADSMVGWRAFVDWTTPETSFMLGNVFAVPSFNTLCPGNRDCISQPGTAQKVDALAPRLMHRAAYRNFGTHQSIVASHTVDAGGGVAGVRWYELRQSNGLPWSGFNAGNIYQASTYAPADTVNRWMGSIAMDREGGIALGYSVSNGSVYPGIRYAGRLANDTLNTFGQTEATMYSGTGSQLGVNRWGDYSSMHVDPIDDCTFWYTQQYVATTASFSWNTRVGAFKFPTCVSAAAVNGAIQGTVTASGMPVQGALVKVGAFTTSTDAAGFYSLPSIPAGTYAASAAKYGYNTATASPVVTAGATTTQNFALTAATTVRLEGYVTDGTAHVYGLYARLSVTAGGLFPGLLTTYTDPLTGYYKIDLVPAVPGYPYTLVYESVYPGYNSRTFTPVALAANTVLNVPLTAQTGMCQTPGYQKSLVTPVFSENWDTTLPSGIPAGFFATSDDPSYPWAVADATYANAQNNSCGGGAYAAPTPVSGSNYLYFNSWCAATGDTARIWYATPMDLAGGGATLSFYMFKYNSWGEPVNATDSVQVQISQDGGATWIDVGPRVYRNDGSPDGWYLQNISIDRPATGPSQVLVALQAISDYDDSIYIDDVVVTRHNCSAIQGAMVVGNVYDANTGAALNEAIVSHDLGGSTYTFPTTGDPAQDDGFYFLFSPIPGVPPAARNITASKGSYNPASATVILPADGVYRQNFALTAGAFTISPDMIKIRTNAGTTASAPLTLQNGGTASASFNITERILPPATYFPGVRPYGASSFRAPGRAPLAKSEFASARAFQRTPAKAQPVLNAVGVGPVFPGTPREQALAVACDELSYYVFGGLDNSTTQNDAYEYDVTSGTWTSLPAMPVRLFQHAGGCINGMIYIAGGLDENFDTTNAFLVFDTITHKWTTLTLPALRWGIEAAVVDGKLYLVGGVDETFTFQTGVWMYDPSTGTFSVKAAMPAARYKGSAVAIGQYIYFTGGGFADVYRYDTVANSWSSGPAMPEFRQWHGVYAYGGYLYVVGGYNPGGVAATTLRYNPSSWPAGTWSVVPTASIALPVVAFGRAATNNKLFLVGGWTGSGYTAVHQFIDDTLSTSQPTDDLPYMTESPASGTVGAGSSQVVSVNFDTTLSTKFGLHAAQLVVNNSTPYGPQAVGTLLTKAFLDVPEGAFGDREIHGLAGARITYGVPGDNYAPNSSVSRAEMAIFLTRSTQGYAFIPPFPGPGLNSFADVTYDHWAANYIEFIYDPASYGAINPIPALTNGCSAVPLNYCPDQPTTRGEMAIFITRAAFGGTQYLAPSPVFGDVPAGHPYRGYIEKIYLEGVTSGCGGGNFCPDRAITRAEMAIFIVRAFNIPYLHH